MEIYFEDALKLLNKLWQDQDLNHLAIVAKELNKQRPANPIVMRYLGITDVLSGKGDYYLRGSAALGDSNAMTWLGISEQFSDYPKERVQARDYLEQIKLTQLRRSQYLDYPTEVSFETQAICNAECTFCPYPTMERKGDRMSDFLIEKILNDLKEIPSNIQFTLSPFKVNEPFLDKRIFNICDTINASIPNAKLRLFTNGSPLTNEIIEKISLIKNVQHIWISLNEFEESAYEQLMGIPFYKTISKLKYLHSILDKGFPHVVIISRVADGSSRDLKFMNFVNEKFPLFKGFLIGRNDWTGQVTSVKTNHIPPTGCSRWYELSIMASGKVALCCMDGEGKHVIGDVNTHSILEIYNNPNFRKLRQYSVNRLAAASPCSECAY